MDDYLDLCRQEGRQPEQPFKGSFNVRMGSDLHRRAALYAKEKGANLNQVVKEALERYFGWLGFLNLEFHDNGRHAAVEDELSKGVVASHDGPAHAQ